MVPGASLASVITLINPINFRGRNTKINYNQFHGTLELRFANGHAWVINELPMEDYLNGLAEGGQGAPMEFLKALAVAARSYAYDALHGTARHPKEHFDVDAEYDQVYKGVVRETANPDWVRAVQETQGEVVTYNGTPVVTPYFAESNGRTRSWSQVWSGTRPWLVSVKAPYDKGHKRLGHGVGMSTHDALIRAKKGTLYHDILTYYYHGTETVIVW